MTMGAHIVGQKCGTSVGRVADHYVVGAGRLDAEEVPRRDTSGHTRAAQNPLGGGRGFRVQLHPLQRAQGAQGGLGAVQPGETVHGGEQEYCFPARRLQHALVTAPSTA